jgi:Uri superfamily endonuclease
MIPAMNARPGTYALLLTVQTPGRVCVGRLGEMVVEADAHYIYIGSAFGPGGVQARIAHHARLAPRPHWHIDYLRAVAGLDEVWYTHDPQRREHEWAAIVSSMRSSSIPLAGFGCSDCACRSHLFAFEKRPTLRSFRRKVRFAFPDHAPITVHGEA